MPKSKTRKRILESAMIVFNEKGYEAAGTKEIATKAGVNETTLFRHFETKKKLFEELLLEYSFIFQNLSEDFDKKVIGDLHHDLTAAAESFLSLTTQIAPFVKLCLVESSINPSVYSQFSPVSQKLTKQLINHLVRLYLQGKIPWANFEFAAQVFYTLIQQYVLSDVNFISPLKPSLARQDYISELVNLIVNYIYASCDLHSFK